MKQWEQQLQQLNNADMFRRLRTVDGAQSTHVKLDGRDVMMLCSIIISDWPITPP